VKAVKDRMSLRAIGLGYSAGLEKGCGDRFDAEFEDICSFSSFQSVYDTRTWCL
jgi:hypothetical protein